MELNAAYICKQNGVPTQQGLYNELSVSILGCLNWCFIKQHCEAIRQERWGGEGTCFLVEEHHLSLMLAAFFTVHECVTLLFSLD